MNVVFFLCQLFITLLPPLPLPMPLHYLPLLLHLLHLPHPLLLYTFLLLTLHPLHLMLFQEHPRPTQWR